MAEPAVRWLVDGMNLIGSRPDRWRNDPDRAVRRLIEELDRYALASGEDLTVVFDRRPPDLAAGAHGAIQVAFASWRGRNAADHEIVSMLAGAQAPGAVTVVTSDRQLGERVRELGATVTSAGAFRRRVDRVLASDPGHRPPGREGRAVVPATARAGTGQRIPRSANALVTTLAAAENS